MRSNNRITIGLLALLAAAALALAACSDDEPTIDASDPGSQVDPSAAAVGSSTPAATSTPAQESATLASASTLLNQILVKPEDVAPEWVSVTDSQVDNAEAARNDPDSAASNERCRRVLARTIVNQPLELALAFVAGETLSVFSTATVYESAAGAEDCSAEAAARLVEPGELARAFGDLFMDPDAVVVVPVDYPQIGDGSFAATLTGDIEAGIVVNITLLIVAFRVENVTAVVGTARAGATPPVDELTTYVDMVRQRIEANN